MDAKRRRSNWPIWIVIALLPVLYVLSAGPMAWLYFYCDFGPESASLVIVRAYAPLEWASKTCPPFGQFCSWYLHFWGFSFPGVDDP